MSALVEHARIHQVASIEESRFGKRYAVDGPLRCPDGRTPLGRVIWFIEGDGSEPQFVTAHPLAEGQDMIRELDSVVLAVDLPALGLKSGDVGTAVLVHSGGEGYEVEFVARDGETIAVTTLTGAQLRPIGHRELAHARPLAA